MGISQRQGIPQTRQKKSPEIEEILVGFTSEFTIEVERKMERSHGGGEEVEEEEEMKGRSAIDELKASGREDVFALGRMGISQRQGIPQTRQKKSPEIEEILVGFTSEFTIEVERKMERSHGGGEEVEEEEEMKGRSAIDVSGGDA
ncbi:predicted protein [Arabidopsis lyrata subsp. lyrata]|uniref:Predicted protein n=1 Tax=Arabidopsis lyrata subsp. lyrata TaxID=81972 RepID=D7L941_ARALL|nr:predicted protein [Arabidopsis lyrata subsp. lyrata]